MITQFKIFEEFKYTPEHLKLISQLRYALKKALGEGCGISKTRSLRIGDTVSRYNNYQPKYVTYTGETMMFSVYVPALKYDDSEKAESYKKIIKEIGLIESGSAYAGTEEQMRELLFKIKYIYLMGDTQKYNL